ncbi:MAG TPA: hypothetical protein P5218_16580 [Planctomycetota bacterium]|nr:hypothetical protein [Planctomycetota bacterium]HRV83050.1 hypothetical protein [Planctomycetota bacterium]
MPDPAMSLFFSALQGVVQQLAGDPADDAAWTQARAALAHYGVGEDQDAELVNLVEARDAEGLAEVLAQWTSGKRLMLERDRDVLKRAMKAYRKTLKVTILAAESSLGGGPMSGGRKSSIVGITPPDRYPREVWEELVRQGRLLGGTRGTYELPPGG